VVKLLGACLEDKARLALIMELCEGGNLAQRIYSPSKRRLDHLEVRVCVCVYVCACVRACVHKRACVWGGGPGLRLGGASGRTGCSVDLWGCRVQAAGASTWHRKACV
jgi:hypothetical protein